MNLTCIIVDDEPMARKLLKEYVKKIPGLELQASIATPLEALQVLNNIETDILFLDVQMPEITGIALLKILKKKPLVILTTAYSEYAIEGYELDVFDYLLKPITFERFLKSMEKVKQRLSEMLQTDTAIKENVRPTIEQPAYIFVKDGTKMVKVKLGEIMYIEGLKDYVKIHTPQNVITTLQRMKTLEELLSAQSFIRVHHSYIIAVEWIDVVHRDKIEVGTATIPVSDTYRKRLKEFIEKKNL